MAPREPILTLRRKTILFPLPAMDRRLLGHPNSSLVAMPTDLSLLLCSRILDDVLARNVYENDGQMPLSGVHNYFKCVLLRSFVFYLPPYSCVADTIMALHKHYRYYIVQTLFSLCTSINIVPKLHPNAFEIERTHVSLDRVQWRASENTAMNFLVLNKTAYILTR
jgi:hypothetical protein